MKSTKTKTARPTKYDQKTAIKGGFLDIINDIGKDAKKKAAAKKS